MEVRDLALNHGIVSRLESFLPSLSTLSYHIIEHVFKTVYTLCRWVPQPDGLISALLPLLIAGVNIHTAQYHIFRTLSWISKDEVVIQSILDCGFVPHLISQSRMAFGNETTAGRHIERDILGIIGNFTAGSDVQTKAVVDAGCLLLFFHYLHSSSIDLVETSCWAISNITCGTTDQLQAVINAEIFPKILHLIGDSDSPVGVMKQAIFAVSNASTNATQEQMRYLLLEAGALPAMCAALPEVEEDLVKLIVDFFASVYESGNKGDPTQDNIFVEYLAKDALKHLEVLESSNRQSGGNSVVLTVTPDLIRMQLVLISKHLFSAIISSSFPLDSGLSDSASLLS